MFYPLLFRIQYTNADVLEVSYCLYLSSHCSFVPGIPAIPVSYLIYFMFTFLHFYIYFFFTFVFDDNCSPLPSCPLAPPESQQSLPCLPLVSLSPRCPLAPAGPQQSLLCLPLVSLSPHCSLTPADPITVSPLLTTHFLVSLMFEFFSSCRTHNSLSLAYHSFPCLLAVL